MTKKEFFYRKLSEKISDNKLIKSIINNYFFSEIKKYEIGSFERDFTADFGVYEIIYDKVGSNPISIMRLSDSYRSILFTQTPEKPALLLRKYKSDLILLYYNQYVIFDVQEYRDIAISEICE